MVRARKGGAVQSCLQLQQRAKATHPVVQRLCGPAHGQLPAPLFEEEAGCQELARVGVQGGGARGLAAGALCRGARGCGLQVCNGHAQRLCARGGGALLLLQLHNARMQVRNVALRQLQVRSGLCLHALHNDLLVLEHARAGGHLALERGNEGGLRSALAGQGLRAPPRLLQVVLVLVLQLRRALRGWGGGVGACAQVGESGGAASALPAAASPPCLRTCVYFWRMTSKASPISLGNSGFGIWEESREAVLGEGWEVLGIGVACGAAALAPSARPPPPPPPPPCTFFSISFSMDSR